nr:C40 family peptidase [Enterococcus sp. BWR-S5]
MLSSLVLSTVGPSTIVFADDVDSNIQQQDQKISGLKSQEATVQTQIASLQNEIAGIAVQSDELQTQQTELRDQTATLETEIADLTKRIEKREDAIQGQARDVQVNGNLSYMDAILSADNFSDAISRVQAMTTIIGANNDLVQQQKTDQQAVEAKKAENDEKSKQIQENQVALEAQKGDIIKAQLDLEILQTGLAAERATAEDQKSSLVQQKAEAEAQRALVAQQEAAAQAAAEQAIAAETAVIPEDTGASAAEDTGTDASNTNNGNGSNTGNTGGNETPAPTPTPEPTPTPTPNPTPTPTPTPEPTPAPDPTGGSAVSVAAAQVGKAYVWGAKGPNSFDCSGLVYYAYMTSQGRNVGGYTVAQEGAGTRISVSEAQAGDLYFWGSPGASWHVAIATGGGGFIHAANPSQGVCYGDVGSFPPSFAVRM